MAYSRILKYTMVSFILIFSFLYYFEHSFEPEMISLSAIDRSFLTKNVRFEANIVEQTLTGETLFLTLKDQNSTIKSILFYANQTLNITNRYDVKGKITLYNQELEIIVTEIKTLN